MEQLISTKTTTYFDDSLNRAPNDECILEAVQQDEETTARNMIFAIATNAD